MNKDEADRALDRLLSTMLTREQIEERLDALDRDLAQTDVPLDCPTCGSTDLWYWDGYWRCGGCGQEWPDQDGEE